MSRNDGGLYSGMTSPKRRELDEKKEQEQKPDPRAELIFNIISDMKNEVLNINNFEVNDDDSDADVRRKVERNKDRIKFLTDMEVRFKVALGVKELPKP